MTRRATCLILVIAAAANGCAADGAGEPEGLPASGVPSSPNEGDPTRTPLLSWGFEPASADCNGWPVLGAAAIRASPARSGAYSCKLCANGSAADLVGLVRDLGAVPPGRYVLTAWVRKRVQNAAPPEAIARIDAAIGSRAVSAGTSTIAVRDEWSRLESAIALGEGASNLRVTIGSIAAEPARCILVDDVSIVREHEE